ncbi:MAG: hypothetical protein KF688_08410 [Pirellulales bacterium]|nr:hypothetical protein [Pirellulales bacterium]
MITSVLRTTAASAAVAAALTGSLVSSVRTLAAEPMAVVAFSGYDALMQDADFIGSLGGQPQASQTIEMMLQMFTQNKGLAGLDKSKPIGVIVLSDQGMIMPLICVPVTDAAELLAVAKGFGVTTQDMGDGMIQIQTPSMPLFGKESGGWLHLSIAPTAVTAAPANVAAMLTDLTQEYDLAARVFVQNVPEAYRQQGIEIISQAAQQGLQKQAGESDDDYAAREKQVEDGLAQLREALAQLDQLTFGLAVDSKQARAIIDGSGTALPGTKLAEEFAKAEKSTTNFAGFFEPEAAMTLCLAAEAAESDLAQMEQQFAAARKEAYKEIDKNDKLSDEGKTTIKSALDDILAAIEATAKAGKFDGGAVLNLEASALTFVAGGMIVEPAKIESALKKIVEVAEKEGKGDMPKVSWNAQQVGGHAFHTLSAPVPEHEAEARTMFGEYVEMAVGIGKESVYFAVGKDWQQKVKSVMDASAASPGKSVPPMEMTFALGQIMNFAKTVAEDDVKPMLEQISLMIANETSGRDHVRMVVQPIKSGQRMRFELEEGVLRSIAMGAMAAQMQAAGAGR